MRECVFLFCYFKKIPKIIYDKKTLALAQSFGSSTTGSVRYIIWGPNINDNCGYCV